MADDKCRIKGKAIDSYESGHLLTYDGDGNRVKSVMGSETTVFIGGYYEVTNPGRDRRSPSITLRVGSG
jgi:hypothetical protein